VVFVVGNGWRWFLVVVANWWGLVTTGVLWVVVVAGSKAVGVGAKWSHELVFSSCLPSSSHSCDQ